MNEYELHCLKILLDFAFQASSSNVPTSIWRYINKIMPIFNDVLFIKNRGIKYQITPLIGVNFNEQTEYIFKNISKYETKIQTSSDFQHYIKYMKRYEQKPKYILNGPIIKKIKIKKVPCYQICAAKDFSYPTKGGGFRLIKKGTLGGFIFSEKNLSQKEGCWIDTFSAVIDDAKIEGNVQLESTIVFDKAIIKNNSYIVSSEIFGNSYIENSFIANSVIKNNCYIADESRIYNSNLWENLEAYNSIIDGCTGGDYVKIENSNVRNQILKGLYSIKNKEIY